MAGPLSLNSEQNVVIYICDYCVYHYGYLTHVFIFQGSLLQLPSVRDIRPTTTIITNSLLVEKTPNVHADF